MAYDRFEFERRMSSDLQDVFAVVRGQAVSGVPVDWSAVETRVANVISDELMGAFVMVLLLMLDDETLGRQLSKLYTSQTAPLIARQLVSNATSALRSGQSLDSILSPARADVIAATEITRAQTAAETEARSRIAQQLQREERQAGKIAPPYSPRGPIDVFPGQNVVWHTAEDMRVCGICGPLHGLKYDAWADEFPYGPPAHPNCRCSLLYE